MQIDADVIIEHVQHILKLVDVLSSKMNNINLFDYIVDILDKTGTWQPNTPLDKYRDLLPDSWATK